MSAKAARPAKGLGRGFDSLIPTELLDESFDAAGSSDRVSDLRYIKVAQIVPDPQQPRRHFDQAALDDLAASLAEHGVLQPLVVVAQADGYQIIAGERRWRAAQLAGLEKVPALVRTVTAQHKLELSLIENLQRKDLNPIETAAAYQVLRDRFGLTLEQISQRVGGRSTSAISNLIRLLRLPDAVQDMVMAGRLSEGQVRPLVGLDDVLACDLAQVIAAEGWTTGQVERYVAQHKQRPATDDQVVSPQPSPQDIHQVQAEQLGHYLDTDVSVRTNTRGGGRIVIRFKNADEFARIQGLLGQGPEA